MMIFRDYETGAVFSSAHPPDPDAFVATVHCHNPDSAPPLSADWHGVKPGEPIRLQAWIIPCADSNAGSLILHWPEFVDAECDPGDGDAYIERAAEYAYYETLTTEAEIHPWDYSDDPDECGAFETDAGPIDSYPYGWPILVTTIAIATEDEP